MLTTVKMRSLAPQALKAMLADGGETALIDLREELTFRKITCCGRARYRSAGWSCAFRASCRVTEPASCCATTTMALPPAPPRYSGAPVTQGFIISDGGVRAWIDAGFELFSGVNVPSKAFGEVVEHASHTPSISAEELAALLREDADIVVLDSRPFDEYQRISIPTATSVPGAELVLRVRELAPSPATTVVVNCAGRTRSIIGAQSLINAGVPNKVVALRNGTMGFMLAGFNCDHGKDKRAPHVSDDTLAWAKAAARRVAERYGVETVSREIVGRWRAESERTLYLFDVRDPPEYAAGHVAGAISAPGGQLVQATDQYAGTLGARTVLVDDLEVRAVMTASWLKQMGWKDVFVLFERGSETAIPAAPILGGEPPADAAIACSELAERLERNAASVIDLSLSPNYRKAHIPGAWFAIRSRLAQSLPKLPLREEIVLTSEDGLLAGIAVEEVRAITGRPVRWLKGGNAAWQAAGLPTSTDLDMADEPLDVWLKPYERSGDTAGAMKEYLSWETDLLPRIERDGTCNFAVLR